MRLGDNKILFPRNLRMVFFHAKELLSELWPFLLWIWKSIYFNKMTSVLKIMKILRSVLLLAI